MATYTPTSTDAAAVAQKLVTQLATVTSIASNVAITNPIDNTTVGGGAQLATADAILMALGYQALDSQFSLGSTTTSSTTFADVGNGSSTGFPTWGWTAPIAKTYLVACWVDCYVSAIGTTGQVSVTLNVDGSIPSQPAAAQRFTFSATNTRQRLSWAAPINFTAGSHTLKLQWKVHDGATTANVSGTLEQRTLIITG